MSLTKAGLVSSVAREIGLPKSQATHAVQCLVDIIKDTLASGEDVLISGFGKFCVHEKSERRGRNPATGDAMVLPPRRVVTFKCSGKLRSKCNGKR